MGAGDEGVEEAVYPRWIGLREVRTGEPAEVFAVGSRVDQTLATWNRHHQLVLSEVSHDSEGKLSEVKEDLF